jgi:5-methylcytosine-specific restriction protein B
MSRYCGERSPDQLLKAAAHWKAVALSKEGSVLSDNALWTDENLTALDTHYVRRPDLGDDGFFEKLERQLAPAPASVKQLVAEMFWLLYLCPSSLTSVRKRSVITQVWSWSGSSLPEDSPWLSDETLAGIGSAGPGFNQNQWRELTFLIRVVQAFRVTETAKQTEVLADSWKFAEWLEQVEGSSSRQFRHMLVFLLFPDDFERIFGQRDRRTIAVAFSGRNSQYVNQLSQSGLDRLLRETRENLEKEYGTKELDYYVSPLAERWSRTTVANVGRDIRKEHVKQALSEIDRTGIPSGADSTGYDLIERARRYPPKYVLELASGYATGERLDRATFSGGEDSTAFRVLRDLGFHIEPKDAIEQLIKKFLAQATSGELGVSDYPRAYRGLQIRVSFGKGNVARIPWISFLAEGEAVSQGIYPVLLFFRQQSALALCYGVSEENEPGRTWEHTSGRQTVDEWFRQTYGNSPDRYGESLVRAVFSTDAQIDFQALTQQLDETIAEYHDLTGTASEPDSPQISAIDDAEPPSVRVDLRAAVTAFAAALAEANVSFGTAHTELVSALLASLTTKPFVVLTGLSGSGKTQIAVRLGEWLGGRLYIAAVRPDWTGAESVFGYEDGLKPTESGRAAWAVPGILEFMLKAVSDPVHPHLLVLDEMNLAHVERYFADVLSGMESRQPCLPNLTRGHDGCWRIVPNGPSRLPLPKNLWVIGTVNVDETTYVFSPKVLDRATVFEFRVGTDDLSVNAGKPVPCTQGDGELVRGLHALANDDAYHHRAAPEFRDVLVGRLRQLHALLSRYGMEFGHRTFYESLRFAALLQLSGVEGLERALDRIVVQKILPRLHGARRHLETPLLALAHFARDLPDESPQDEKLGSLAPDRLAEGESAKLPTSFNKIGRMLRSLRANQFASFAE